MTQNDKTFRFPAWAILIAGFICDFSLSLFGKISIIEIEGYGKFPTYTTCGIAIFLVLNLIPQIKKYIGKK